MTRVPDEPCWKAKLLFALQSTIFSGPYDRVFTATDQKGSTRGIHLAVLVEAISVAHSRRQKDDRVQV